MTALPIRQDYSPSELRRLAGREPDRRAALRLLAVANALEGMPRAEAARLAGMERQALRDAVLRFNAAGPAGLHDKPRSGAPSFFFFFFKKSHAVERGATGRAQGARSARACAGARRG